MDLAELRMILHQQVSTALTGTGLEVTFTPLFQGVSAMETPAHAKIIQLSEHLTQHTAEAVAFATEAPYLQTLGMETVILGPGNIAQAHQPNEFINLNCLQPMVDILTQLIQYFCILTD